MMLVDDKHLFMFKMPPLGDWTSESAFYLPDTFYSSDLSQIERTSEMLNDIWKRGIEISEVSSQAGMKLPRIEVPVTETVSALVNSMLQNSVNSVLIMEHHRPIGVISDRDILRDIIEQHKDPTRTFARDLSYTPLIILDEAESMINAMQVMRQKGMKRAAMVKNGQLVGMLTEEAVKKAAVQVQAAPAPAA
jgi:CBS domain-containing protein